MESTAHQHLKILAMAHLRQLGFRAAAMEVRCPISRFRVDVAGYSPGRRDAGSPAAPRTVIIECKQSREDFLRDNQHRPHLLDLRQKYDAMRRSIELNRIRRTEPALRRSGTSLFPELEDWDFAASRSRSYRRVLATLRRLDGRLHGQTKFHTIARYSLADQMYIASPRGLITRHELPPGWGLLECDPGTLAGMVEIESAPLAVAVEAPGHHSREVHRLRLLHGIAVAASSQLERRASAPG